MEQAEQLTTLNKLRVAARRAMLYLALLLLGVLVFWLFLGWGCALALAGATLALDRLWLGPERRRYKDAVQQALLMRASDGLKDAACAASSGLSPADIRGRRLLPMNDAGLLLRYSLSGRAKTGEARFCDLSYVYTYEKPGGGKRTAAFSGCWAQESAAADCGFTAVFCPARLLLEAELLPWFARQNLRPATVRSRSVLCFEDPERPVPPAFLERALPRIEALGEAAVRYDETGACALLLHRFLNCGEPDYKQTWTKARIDGQAPRWPGELLGVMELPFDGE